MSTSVETKKRYTPEELLAMPDGERFELVDGQLVERDVSSLSSAVALEIGGLLRAHCRANSLGWVFGSDCGFRCFPQKPDQVRMPDASFVPKDRWSEEDARAGYVTVAPDLAVEVLSPNDVVYETTKKVREYLDAGVKLVWEINPLGKTVFIHRADGTVEALSENDELSGESVVPGFRCKVGEIFSVAP